MSRPFITPHVLNQYVKDEKSSEFYFRLLAWLAVNEPMYWEWSDREIMGDLNIIAQKVGNQVFAMSPQLGAVLHHLFRRWSARAFILGMRRLSSEAGMPMEFDFILPSQDRKDTPEIPWGERREIDPQDFLE